MKLAELTHKLAKLTIDHSPTILTTLGVAGTVTTVYLTGKASFQAADIIRRTEEERGYAEDPKERLKDRFKLVWKLYIPAGTMGVASIACILSANHVSNKRAAGLAAAYTLSEKTFEEYRRKVIDKIGERKEEAVRDEIAQDRVNETWSEGVTIHGLEHGELCYDKYSDRYFWGTVEGIKRAENELNYAVIHDGYASLSTFYDLIGLPPTGFSEEVGWTTDKLMELKISSTLTSTNRPCIAIDFKVEPVRHYFRFS